MFVTCFQKARPQQVSHGLSLITCCSVLNNPCQILDANFVRLTAYAGASTFAGPSVLGFAKASPAPGIINGATFLS